MRRRGILGHGTIGGIFIDSGGRDVQRALAEAGNFGGHLREAAAVSPLLVTGRAQAGGPGIHRDRVLTGTGILRPPLPRTQRWIPAAHNWIWPNIGEPVVPRRQMSRRAPSSVASRQD